MMLSFNDIGRKKVIFIHTVFIIFLKLINNSSKQRKSLTMRVFGNLILIRRDLYDFISTFSPQNQFGLRGYIKHLRQRLTTFSKYLEIHQNQKQSTACHYFQLSSQCLESVVKHSLSCLIIKITCKYIVAYMQLV